MSDLDDIRELVEEEERNEELDYEVEDLDLVDRDQERVDEQYGYGDFRPWGYGY